MNKSEETFEPHLIIRELSVPAGGEWMPPWPGWSVIQVREGMGYYLQPPFNHELETGAVLLIFSGANGTIRASQLGTVSLCCFNVIPSRLGGLITLAEQQFFETAMSGREPRIIPARDRVAQKMCELTAGRGRGLAFRLQLLDVFTELFGAEPEASHEPDSPTNARNRLQDLLQKTPSSELVEMDFSELAKRTHCTERHLSRIFHELVGMSFRDKRAELRLMRARELLATTNAKVVDVALESGYKSLSLFNLMFARKFGLSPGRWRKQHAIQARTRAGGKKILPLPVVAISSRQVPVSHVRNPVIEQ